MSQNVQIIFINDNPEHKKAPFKVIQEITDENKYIESVSFKTEIIPTVDFPFMALFTEFEEAKLPTIRSKHAKHIKYSLSDLLFVQNMQSISNIVFQIINYSTSLIL